MAKFYGMVGFSKTILASPGVYDEQVIERPYYGDVIRHTRRWEQTDKTNDNVTINNSISIVADSYANENLYAMKYIWWMGARWRITDIEVQRPRLILSIGGVYNGPEVTTT